MNNAEKKYLRAKSHGLKPVIIVGANGVTDAVNAEIERALLDHELIKVRISHKEREVRQAMTQDILKASGAELINSIGHIIAIYKPNPK